MEASLIAFRAALSQRGLSLRLVSSDESLLRSAADQLFANDLLHSYLGGVVAEHLCSAAAQPDDAHSRLCALSELFSRPVRVLQQHPDGAISERVIGASCIAADDSPQILLGRLVDGSFASLIGPHLAAVSTAAAAPPPSLPADAGERSWAAERAAFLRDGLVFPVRGLLSSARLDEADALLSSLVAERPPDLAAEDLLNLHWTVPGVLALCREPRVLSLARALLGAADVAVFTSRILCKLPGGKELPWHQDSLYWPLERAGGAAPAVASLWLALDDLAPEMGPMEVLPYTAAPATRGRSAAELVLDAGGDVSGFDNFNLSLDPARLDVAGARTVAIARGEAEWHAAFVAHRSGRNASERRRLAFIVRFVHSDTRIIPGVRSAFTEDFPIVPVCGARATDGLAREGLARYAPCYGGAVVALKK